MPKAGAQLRGGGGGGGGGGRGEGGVGGRGGGEPSLKRLNTAIIHLPALW